MFKSSQSKPPHHSSLLNHPDDSLTTILYPWKLPIYRIPHATLSPPNNPPNTPPHPLHPTPNRIPNPPSHQHQITQILLHRNNNLLPIPHLHLHLFNPLLFFFFLSFYLSVKNNTTKSFCLNLSVERLHQLIFRKALRPH